jgi:hypothetical protein
MVAAHSLAQRDFTFWCRIIVPQRKAERVDFTMTKTI